MESGNFKLLLDKFKDTNKTKFAGNSDVVARIDGMTEDNTILTNKVFSAATASAVIFSKEMKIFGINQQWNRTQVYSDIATDLTELYPTEADVKALNTTGLFRLGSGYGTFIKHPVVMSNNNTPTGYIANASTQYDTGSYGAWRTFDNTTQYGWSSKDNVNLSPTNKQWIQLQFPENKRVTRYAISNRIPDPQPPKDWTLSGSMNGVDWTVIDTVSGRNNVSPGWRSEHDLSSPQTWRLFRLEISAAAKASVVNIGEIEFYDSPSVPSGMVAVVSEGSIESGTYLDEVKALLRIHLKVGFNDSDLTVDLSVPTKPVVTLNSIGVYGTITVISSDPPKSALFVGQVNETLGFDWIVPEGVTSICACAISPGGLNASSSLSGGSGGLSYKNNIPVTPGETLKITISNPWTTARATGIMRGSGYLLHSMSANGSTGGLGGSALNSTYSGQSGKNGRTQTFSSLSYPLGVGAAGYDTAGTGGGGDGAFNSAAGRTGGGGGTGIILRGATGGVGDANSGYVGKPGSGGNGVNFGGSAGWPSTDAGIGGVRIIWGTGRNYPLNSAD